jgi:flagellar hook-associated protein 1 FlgK
MNGDLLAIASSGAKAARAALDVTAQNISNASTDGYVRRSVSLADVTSTGLATGTTAATLSGVRIAGIVRNADAMRSAEVRRTGSDLARANAQVEGYTDIENAVEQTGVYASINTFEAGLQELAADPTSTAQRGVVLQDARNLAQSFNTASSQLDSAGATLAQQASDGIAKANSVATQIVQLNQQLIRSAANGSDQTGLLDQRDTLLQQLAGLADVTTTFAANGSVTVQLGGAGGPSLVNSAGAATLNATTAANGTIAFDVGGTAVSPSGGSLAGLQLALTTLDATRTALDTVATSVIGIVNVAQTGGVDLTGAAGQPMFSGTSAANIAVPLQNSDQIATAPYGAGAGSRSTSNIDALNQTLISADPAGAMDKLLSGISNTVAGASTGRDTLQTIADSAKAALQQGAGVNLDQEAVNLVHFQQAFQASGKVIQVASTLFNQLLAIT